MIRRFVIDQQLLHVRSWPLPSVWVSSVICVAMTKLSKARRPWIRTSVSNISAILRSTNTLALYRFVRYVIRTSIAGLVYCATCPKRGYDRSIDPRRAGQFCSAGIFPKWPTLSSRRPGRMIENCGTKPADVEMPTLLHTSLCTDLAMSAYIQHNVMLDVSLSGNHPQINVRCGACVSIPPQVRLRSSSSTKGQNAQSMTNCCFARFEFKFAAWSYESIRAKPLQKFVLRYFVMRFIDFRVRTRILRNVV